MARRWIRFLVLAASVAAGCRAGGEYPMEGRSVTREPFGITAAGDTVERITLTNAGGSELSAITHGATITNLLVPDRAGILGDVVLGFDSLGAYVDSSPYFGAVAGRVANRIAKGRFTLDGHTYELAVNNGPNHLHGGLRGFDKVNWRAETFQNDSAVGVTFKYRSPNGEEGYPGNLDVAVTYTLGDDDRVTIEYEATTDKATPVNLTQHSYFNLAETGDVLAHELTLVADRITPIDPTLIPTGAFMEVAGTPFDFRRPHAIGSRIGADDEQLRIAGGYDHNYVITRGDTGLALAARLHDPLTGRTLEVLTTEPGVQFYTGNFLDGTIMGKHGHVYSRRTGVCLETQHFPDSPNQRAFPSTILRPGKTLRSMTVWKFTADAP